MTNLKIEKTDFVDLIDSIILPELGLSSTCSKCPNKTSYGYINNVECNGVVLGQMKVSLCEKHFNEIPFSCLHAWQTRDIMTVFGKEAHLEACLKCQEIKVEVYK